MPELQEFPLFTRSGAKGTVWRGSRFLDRNQMNHVRLEDGSEFDVPSASLRVQSDGSFLLDQEHSVQPDGPPPLDLSSTDLSVGSAQPAPARIEQVSGNGNEITLDEPLFTEEVFVEHVPINRILDAPAETRQEGNVTIVPVMEEVITVQKRLLLKKEIRIERKRTELRSPRRVLVNGGETRIIGADGTEHSL